MRIVVDGLVIETERAPAAETLVSILLSERECFALLTLVSGRALDIAERRHYRTASAKIVLAAQRARERAGDEHTLPAGA